MTNNQLQELCHVAKKAATMAGEYIQSQFDQHYIKKNKVGGDSLASQVVTEVDIKAQEIILSHLNHTISAYDLGLLTEEATDDQSRRDKTHFWCIDPMDGTLPFTERRTGYAVSIALISKEGDPVIGVVYIPDLRACYSAIKGEGLFLKDELLNRNKVVKDDRLHFYMDQSFQSESYYAWVRNELASYAKRNNLDIKVHDQFGGVRNAIGVICSKNACYFKFAKKTRGCGSIWDYAATRLFAEEFGTYVSNIEGNTLHLNNPESTFMNEQGVLYATDEKIAAHVLQMRKQLNEQ